MRNIRRWFVAASLLLVAGAVFAFVNGRHRPRPDPEPGTFSYTQVAVGHHTVCALRSDGAVWCSGANHTGGALGVGIDPRTDAFATSTPLRTLEVGATPLTGVVELVAGAWHNCARKADGSVWCWGRNYEGQAGIGIVDGPGTSSDGAALVATEVVGDLTFTQISGGHFVTCGVAEDATVWCWGGNDRGELARPSHIDTGDMCEFDFSLFELVPCEAGDACLEGGECVVEVVEVPEPVQIFADASTPLTDVTKVEVGPTEVCALVGTGGVWCWGGFNPGGSGTAVVEYVDGTLSADPYPRHVATPGPVLDLGVGGHHTCALSSSGIDCWGSNKWGQLGDGTTDTSEDPVVVDGLSSVAEIEVAYNHNCGRKVDGSVHCWGSNYKGQIGDASNEDALSPVPMWPPLGLAGGAISIGVGGSSSCAVASDGGVLCTGENGYGQLGDGTTVDRNIPGAMLLPRE